MIYKSLMLVMVFSLAFGINTKSALDKPYRCPCNCIDLVVEAVDAVIATSFCDLNGIWEVPGDFENQPETLQNWCNNLESRAKSKRPEFIDSMLEMIHLTIVGESCDIDGETVITSDPAPDCAIEALLNLQNLLLYGCPKQLIE